MTDDWRPAHDSPIALADSGVGDDLAVGVELDHGFDSEQARASAVEAAEQLNAGLRGDEGEACEASRSGHDATLARIDDAGEGRRDGGVSRDNARRLTPELLEEIAQCLTGSASVEAFRRLDAGEFDGTATEAELRMLRFLTGTT